MYGRHMSAHHARADRRAAPCASLASSLASGRVVLSPLGVPTPGVPSPSVSPSPEGVVGRWLTDPGGVEHDVLGRVGAELAAGWAQWRPLIVALAVFAVVVRLGLWGWRVQAWRSALARARWVEVVAPPVTQTAQAQQLWRQLAGLLRPGRLGGGARLLAWELHADGDRAVAGLWVPGGVAVQQVSRAVTSAYPRTRIRLGPIGPDAGPVLASPRPAPPGVGRRVWAAAGGVGGSARVGGPVSAGYVVVPASMWAPLLAGAGSGSGQVSPRARSSEAGADGLRMACAALAAVPPGYIAVLQVLVRPLPPGTRRAARRVRRSQGGPPGPGVAVRVLLGLVGVGEAAVRAVLDLAIPGPATRPAPTAAGARGRIHQDGADPVVRAERHLAEVKAGSELVEVCVRVVVTGHVRTVCREQAFEVANALRGVVTAQPTHAVRLPAAGRAVAVRRRGNRLGPLSGGVGHRRGWFVATDTEVGALARLPHQPGLYGFEVARAPHLPAPAGIPRIGVWDGEEPAGPPGWASPNGTDDGDGEAA
jgi:hypothetical protein